MMLGALVWAAAALYGLQALFARFDWLYLAFRIGGALYLLYLAVMLWRHAGDPLPEMPAARSARRRGWQGFLRALLLQLEQSQDHGVLRQHLPVVAAGSSRRPGWTARCWPSWRVNEFTWFALLALLFSGERRAPSIVAPRSGSIASWAACWRCWAWKLAFDS